MEICGGGGHHLFFMRRGHVVFVYFFIIYTYSSAIYIPRMKQITWCVLFFHLKAPKHYALSSKLYDNNTVVIHAIGAKLSELILDYLEMKSGFQGRLHNGASSKNLKQLIIESAQQLIE